jgi:hypothetical protein
VRSDHHRWCVWFAGIQVCGLLSDTVPVMGYRRGPYFVLASALGFLAALFLR